MIRQPFLRWGMLGLFLLFLGGCTPSVSVPTPTVAIPSTPAMAPATVPVTVTRAASATAPAPGGPVTLIGNAAFVEQTQAALLLLQTKAPDAYNKVEAYVGIIEQSEHSGMWAAEDPPRYTVGDATAFYSVTWYASTIAHDATHSELYHQYLASYGAPVPDDVWTGVEVERFCNAYQLDVLKRIGGTSAEIEYLAGLDGTHCDIDNDGDCDWDDYSGRDW
jgi:hypothetical protein